MLDDADSDRFVRERLARGGPALPALAKTQRADLLRFGLLLHLAVAHVDAPMVIPLDAVFPIVRSRTAPSPPSRASCLG